MALDFDNLVIDRPLRARMQDKSTGELWFVVDELKEATLTNGAEQVFMTGSAGTRIATLDRNKTTTLTFQNGLVSMSMMATQTGSARELAAADNTITTPAFEIHEVKNHSITLSQTPVAHSVQHVYALQKDRSLGAKYSLNDAVSTTGEGEGTTELTGNIFTLKDNVITLSSDLAEGTKVAVSYQYEAKSAIKVVNRGDTFAKKGIVILEILLRDICDNNKKYYANLVIPNGAMSGQFDININGEGTVHAATVEAMPDYCSIDKELFSWIIPDATENVA